MASIPIVMTPSGVQPQDPQELRAELVAEATALSPGLTANLPGSLVEDMASTGTGGLIVCDQAVAESINNVTPLGANQYMLGALGYIYGVRPGVSANASVYVIFSGDVGFVISPCFTVSDGSHQYVVQNGGIVGSSGDSAPLYCVATQPGDFAIPANTVNAFVTSIPGTVTLSVTNPTAGTPAIAAETAESYRARTLQSGQATSLGMLTFLKTQIQQVSGVQSRLVSVRAANGGYEVIVGGGDPYEVAYAIYKGVFDINSLVGSVISITAVTNANPGEATTNINHGYIDGQSVTISGASPGTFNGTYTVTVVDEKTFTIGVDTSAFGSYVGGGIASPNNRNQLITINDYPDSYDIPFVVPPVQSIAIALTWNTSATNVISSAAIEQMSVPAIAAYINSIPVGQPINVFELENAFQAAVASVIPSSLITKMQFVVTINGIVTAPNAGAGIVVGDPESYFFCNNSDVTVARA